MANQQSECSAVAASVRTKRTHMGGPWVGSVEAGAIEIRDRADQAVVTIKPTSGPALTEREFAIANLIIAAPHLADFAQEFLEHFAGDLSAALVRMQEHPEHLAELQLLASLGVARMHGTAGVTR